MSGNETPARFLFERLRRLAAERPGEARSEVARLLDERPMELQDILLLISAPGEGRLRHIVTNSIVENPERACAVPISKWYAIETDEFTKNALRRAVRIVEKAAPQASASKPETSFVDQPFFEAYRYCSRRLRHRFGNALRSPDTAIMDIRDALSALPDASLREELTRLVEKLEERFRQVGRIVEFDFEEDYFQMRQIPICEWLVHMNEAYAQRYSAVDLCINASPECERLRVYANQHLLEEIFWNLWTNAHQEVRKDCRIIINMSVEGSLVRLVVLDNGDGFSPAARDAAFAHQYSSAKHRRGHFGQGLLEVKDAAERLHGTASLVELEGRYRVMIALPWEVSGE